jgi:L-phenylalanine/L-methionine N-acetyltransferase
MRDGLPRVARAWMDSGGGHVRIDSVPGHVKDRNMARDPCVGLAICDLEAPSGSVQVRGRVLTVTTDGARGRDQGRVSSLRTGVAYPRWLRCGTESFPARRDLVTGWEGSKRVDYAVVIRPVRIEDAADIAAIRLQPGVLAGTLNVPSERLLDQQRQIEALDANDHDFVAEVDGRAVGTARLVAFHGRLSHCGEIAHLMIHDEFQGRGIGRQLMEALLDVADNYLGLVRVELLVYPDNTSAVHLYESLGFAHKGVKRKFSRRQGRLTDALMMARIHTE